MDRDSGLNLDRATMRTALVTGATRGLGLALARELARRGWNLIIDGRDVARLRALRDELAVVTHVAAIAGDVGDASHRQELAVLARGHAGLHAVINNAGTLGPSPLPQVLELDEEQLIDVMRTNVAAPIALLRAVHQSLEPGARIVNVTSDAAVNAYPGWGAYGASKAALEQLSNVLAAELATTRPDLRVYWVDPGDMRTDMHQAAFPGEDISDRPEPETRVGGFVHLLEGTLPSGRYRVADLIADDVLAGPELRGAA
ncbi:MAG: short-chain dehydrogenase/reductase [Gemmatimonadetes bacterium]|nr:short-chain dehydrogenase/reductase [Gemmatimonadota bacterium]